MATQITSKKELQFLGTYRYFYLAAVSILLQIIIFYTSLSQTNSNFNVNLLIDFTAVEQSIALFQDEYVNIQTLSESRGNRIAASTTELVANRRSAVNILRSYLDSLRYHQIIKDDIYNLESARKNAAAIKQLMEELKKRNFSRRVAATVEQIFPDDVNISIGIPVFVVSLGHENVDAYVRRIIWHGDAPQFVGENEGEITIVINLAHSVDYGPNLEERFITLLGIVAHEVFHASFSAYKENSLSWKNFYKLHHQPLDMLLDLTQNEGIAYYLSFDQRGQGYIPHDWNIKSQQVFAVFNKNASQLSSDTITHERAAQLIRNANLSGGWESYGSMTGMFIAREIDLQLGRSALIETISLNPYAFFEVYNTLTQQNSNLPIISQRILQKIDKNRNN